jgi:hypothetical protein
LNSTSSFTIEAQRKLFIKKDLIALSHWIDELEALDKELNSLKHLEQKVLKNAILSQNITTFRRKNTLAMGLLCQYEQVLRTEFEYGKAIYDVKSAKLHEKKQNEYLCIKKSFMLLKDSVYKLLETCKRN